MSKPTPLELNHAVKTLALLVRRGFPLSKAVQNISDTHPVWVEVKKSVQSGDNTGQALRRYPHLFSSFFSGMIEAAEKTPNGDAILTSLSTWMETTEEVRRKIKELLYYPLLLLSFLCIECGVLVGFAAPTSLLPLIYANDWGHVGDFKGVLTALSFLFFVLSGLTLVASWKTDWVLPLALKFPAFRATTLKSDQALWARAVACYLQAGHTLPEALKACNDIVWTPELRAQLKPLPERLATGDLLSKALSDLDLIDPQLRWSVTAGESKEDLSGTLFYAAEQMERHLLSEARAFFLFLQPCAIAVVGIITAVVLGSFWHGIYHYSWNLTL